jgi:membrane protein DedA with SNARE-associated domain
MTHFVEDYGLWVVFVIVFLEVGGLPFVPGETALITAAVLASQRHGSIVWTIALAILAAVLGAAAAYAVGRGWGRGLLAFWPWLERISAPAVRRSDDFFKRHGAKAVFIGRFLPLLRATLGWMAGVGAMSPVRFAFWNVAGAVVWGIGVGLAAYYAGAAVVDTIQRDAAVGVGIIVILLVGLVGVHVVRGRLERS